MSYLLSVVPLMLLTATNWLTSAVVSVTMKESGPGFLRMINDRDLDLRSTLTAEKFTYSGKIWLLGS